MIPSPTAADRDALADRATYTGSIEHKDKRSWLGLPQARGNPSAGPDDTRQNATICPLVSAADKETATRLVKDAIKRGQFRPEIWSGHFPREIWHRDRNGQYWYGRLTNAGGDDGPGEYKGWPISRDEWNENFG